MGSTSQTTVTVGTVQTPILQKNPNRGSYYILNQHAVLAIWVCSGSSAGANVTTAGDRMGARIGPNGGELYDDNDKDIVWAVSTAANTMVLIMETTNSPKLIKEIPK